MPGKRRTSRLQGGHAGLVTPMQVIVELGDSQRSEPLTVRRADLHAGRPSKTIGVEVAMKEHGQPRASLKLEKIGSLTFSRCSMPSSTSASTVSFTSCASVRATCARCARCKSVSVHIWRLYAKGNDEQLSSLVPCFGPSFSSSCPHAKGTSAGLRELGQRRGCFGREWPHRPELLTLRLKKSFCAVEGCSAAP